MASPRRRYGNAAAAGVRVLSGAVQTDINRRLGEEDERRRFNQRLQALGIQTGMQTGQLSPMLSPQGQVTGFQRGQIQPSPGLDLDSLVSSGAEITQTIKTPQGTITIKRGGKTAAPKPPSEAETGRLLLGAQPGQPFPVQPRPIQVGINSNTGNPMTQPGGGLPSSPGGQQLLQQLITSGQTEPPGSVSLGEQYAPHTFPQGPFVSGPGGTFIGGQGEVAPGFGVSRNRVIDLVRQPSSASTTSYGMPQTPMTPQLSPGLSTPRAPIMGAEEDLPDPSGMRDGTIIEDDQTGQQYRLVQGQWQPI